MKAGPKKESSFTWQRIVAGLNIFSRGHIWRIGSGANVNIWENHCIPIIPNRKVISSHGQFLLRTIAELINPHTGLWDEDLVREIFVPIDAEHIRRIPLSEHLTEDFVAWHYTKTFTFWVRSAYYWEHQIGAKV